MTNAETLKRLFWSAGRKVWMGVTIGDAARRLAMPPTKAKLILVEIERQGYATRVRHPTSYNSSREFDIIIWDITEQGKEATDDAAK